MLVSLVVIDVQQAIRRYGTDFTLLEKLFVKRSRKQLKSKFKREEKENPRRVDEALRNTIPIGCQTWYVLFWLTEKIAADIEHYHTAINQAAEKKKLLEEQRDQANTQAQQTSTKDDNSWEKPALDTTTSQKTNNTTENSTSNSTKEPQVDEIELDEVSNWSCALCLIDYFFVGNISQFARCSILLLLG